MKLPPAENQTLLHTASRRTAAAPSAALGGHRLPEGARVGEFEITGVIGEGGFGIVYMAFDHSLQRRVALKEYMPSSLAMRTPGTSTVEVKFEHQVDTFNIGLRSFVNEARLLAQFDHPALVKVHRFWEANGTAYMAMPFYEGPTLRAALSKLGHPPDEQWLRHLLDPLLDALGFLHAAQCFHRDIAPDNILLTSTGPLLLDFGAARRVIGAANQALTVILKPGYAPIEQYGQATSMGQGPWTDVYALACVVYCAITGKAPVASVERFMEDRLQPVSKLAAGRYNQNFLRAIDAGLAVKPEHRPKDIAAFRALLDGAASPHDATEIARTQRRTESRSSGGSSKSKSRTALREQTPWHEPDARPVAAKRKSATAVWLGAAAAIALTTITGVWFVNTRQAEPQTSESAKPPAPTLVVGTPIEQNTLSDDSQPAAAPAAAPERVDVALSQASHEQDAPPQANSDAQPAPARPESSGGVATAEPQRPAPAPSAAQSTTGSAVENSTDEARCADLLRKFSLESLSAEETDFLGSKCR